MPTKKASVAKVEEESLPGYPVYPESDDIYSREEEVRMVNPDDPSQLKVPAEAPGKWNEKDFRNEVTGDDLDVPGSEAEEDGAETPGNEDEENEYYSLGGDDHEDLDEDNADRQ